MTTGADPPPPEPPREPPPDATYRDPGASVADRVEDLLGRMTRAEKVAQLTSIWLTIDPDSGAVAPSQMFGLAADVDPAEAMAHGIGQITRPLGSRPVAPVDGVRSINALQRRLREQTRLGIPAICHEECLSGLMAQGATSFPSPLNLAATWDPALVEQVTATIRRQMRMLGAHQGLAPVADVARDPRWGRIEETQGEDPYLVGAMVSAYVRGLQGDDLRRGVVATLKHFAAYSASEGGRNFAPAHVGPRELRDLHLRPFEMAVRGAGCRSVMNSYQEIDGVPPAAARWLLTGVLRDEWGFEGTVVADYGAVSFLRDQHRVAADAVEASALALGAGLDVELPNPVEYPAGIPAAIDRGLLGEGVLDDAVRRVLAQKFELGLFEDPFVDPDAVELDTADDRRLAAEVARRSMTLLANDGMLPLGPEPGKVAVIGPNADEVMALFGNYSFENHLVSTHFHDAAELVSVPTLLDAFRTRLGEQRVAHASGCDIPPVGQAPGDATASIAEAVQVADAADVAVVVVGDRAGHFRLGTVGEGTDAVDLSLPGAQHQLVEAVLDTGTPTVVVLVHGRPFALEDLPDRAGAILSAWFPGQDGATAVVDTLFGDVNPGGRTPVSFGRLAGAMPAPHHARFLARGVPPLPEYEPVFAFGHGLGYTTVEYSDLVIDPAEVPVSGDAGRFTEVTISCTVTNTGHRDGDEVVQLYVHDPLASVTRPALQLCGFHRVALGAGASARVRFEVPTDVLSFCGTDMRWIVEPGAIEVRVGASSSDLRLKGSFELVGDGPAVSARRRLLTSSSAEILRR